ncbi:MAG: hypothetical protein IKQ93_07845 [Candidatus Methanomethylophilaceae archaeon]|nr:hypothetical protein [Candidatus Methanomethylophilaceae archaeon]MBR6911675.1 hypothetical protein [Candidatus Methanomethylophilaceae archaeon]
MVKELSHLERVSAALNDEPVDRLPVYPIACGVSRQLLNGGNMTYEQWARDANNYANGFEAAHKRFDLDFAIGLMDLSVIAADLGSHVRFDDAHTPSVDGPFIKNLEDYDRLEVPDINEGRIGTIIKGSELLAKKVGKEAVTSAFLEGPLLVLTQSATAEKVFLDYIYEPETIKRSLRKITEFEKSIVEAVGKTGVSAICWDYLWANYSVLDDTEYKALEGDHFAPELNDATKANGMAVAIHNCADLPHLDTQIKEFKPSIYSMAYYPLVEGSLSASQVIGKGYADETLVAGNLDPQAFEQYTVEQVENSTKALAQEVKTALCERGLNSRYVLASGCEVPPTSTCRLDNIDAFVRSAKQYGSF